MTKRWLIGLLVLGALGVGLAQLYEAHPLQFGAQASKRVIGQTAWVEISESGLGFLGRVDTGAASTSVNAESIRVRGDMVEFVLVNRTGGRVSMRAPLAKTTMVRNAMGHEKRRYVDLTIRHEGMEKQVRASLNDRSELTYALLLGRDWLQDDYVVDVTRQPFQLPDPSGRELYIPADSRGIASR